MRDERPADRPTPRVVVIGAGASGSLTALHLARAARRREVSLDVVLVDPCLHRSRGTAFGTADPQHLLNVPAGGMSALPDDPGHLVSWLRGHGHADATPADFVPRADYGSYLQDTFASALRDARMVTAEHRCQRVRHARPVPGGVHLALADSSFLTADAMVLAPGIFAPGTAWAPAALAASDRFVADPWAPGALDQLDQLDEIAIADQRCAQPRHDELRLGRGRIYGRRGFRLARFRCQQQGR
jgi:uncharacterized NAD(P)/FAD-binding protein YdhS